MNHLMPTNSDTRLILDLIDAELGKPGLDFNRQLRLNELKAKLLAPVSATQLASTGGDHLAVVRSWIQVSFIDGDTCTWGSTEPFKGCKIAQSPLMYEHLANRIAAAAISEYGFRIKGFL
jgi:hypothetical protein